jgi:succinate dehydrogenase/fumarate reductase flavoprotein subunit
MKRNKESKQDLSRRDFIKTTAVGVGATALAGLGAKEAKAQEEPLQYEIVTDVVIVGTGGAGLAAAIEAKAAGAKVLIIEKDPYIGGLWVTAGGNSFFCNTHVQKRLGVEDHLEWGIADEMLISDFRAVPEIVRTYVEKGAETCLWYENLGITWSSVLTDGQWGTGVLRNHVATTSPTGYYAGTGGTAQVTVMLKRVIKDGTPILLKHRMKRIIRRPDGPVVGIEVETESGTVNIRARKAVVIASGSFTTNEQMIKAWDPRLVNDACYSDGLPYTSSMGDGLLAAMDIGAAVSDLSFVCYTPIRWGSHVYTVWGDMNLPENNPLTMTRRPPTGPGVSLVGSGYQRIILVKNDGLRYINESWGATTVERGVSREFQRKYQYGPAPMGTNETGFTGPGAEWPEHPFMAIFLSLPNPKNVWAIADADGAKAMNWPEADMRNPKPPPGGISPLWPDSVAVVDSLQQLAAKTGIDPTNLAATVARYNGFVDAGVDQDFGKPMPMYKIAKPPFFAAKLNIIRHTPRNGLRVNTKGQVIEANYFVDANPTAEELLLQGNLAGTAKSIDEEKVIPHLYAVGEVTATLGWRRAHRSCGPYSILGRITGQNAAKEPILP